MSFLVGSCGSLFWWIVFHLSLFLVIMILVDRISFISLPSYYDIGGSYFIYLSSKLL